MSMSMDSNIKERINNNLNIENLKKKKNINTTENVWNTIFGVDA